MADIIDGKAMRLRIDDVAVTKATNCSISITRETRSRSHKDVAAGFTSNDYGTGSWEASGEAFYAEGESYDALLTAMLAKTKVDVEMSTNVAATKKTTGTGIITSLEMNAPDEEDTTFSFSITGDGNLTRANVA